MFWSAYYSPPYGGGAVGGAFSLRPNTIFAFLTAQNCELNEQRNLWLEIREF